MLKKYQKLQDFPRTLNENKSVLFETYCWRKDLVSRYESLWSLLHKFALLNAIEGNDVRAIFAGKSSKNSNNFWRWNNRADLRYLNGIDTLKLANILALSERGISESAVATYLRQDEVLWLSSRTLRFCLECFQMGFHSSLYQLISIFKCPIHEADLSTKCPYCEYEIPYRLDKNSFARAFGCPNCNEIFCKQLLEVGCKLPPIENLEKRLGSIYSWLLRRIESPILEASIVTDSKYDLIKNKSREKVFNLLAYWMKVFEPVGDAEPSLVKQTNFYSGKEIHVKIVFKSLNECGNVGAQFDKNWDDELYSIYKSIVRHLVKTQLRKHIKCIEIQRRKFLLDKRLRLSAGNFCEAASAYIFWRMYYEGATLPARIFKKSKRNKMRFSEGEQKIFWSIPSYKYSKCQLNRIFALECYWLFYECKLLAKKFNSMSITLFDSRYITEGLIPHWIITPGERKNNSFDLCEMHRWIQVDELGDLLKPFELH